MEGASRDSCGVDGGGREGALWDKKGKALRVSNPKQLGWVLVDANR